MSLGSHTPVLLAAAVESLRVRADGVYVDCTFGRAIVIHLLRAVSNVGLLGEYGRWILHRREGFDSRSALALRVQREPQVPVRSFEVLAHVALRSVGQLGKKRIERDRLRSE